MRSTPGVDHSLIRYHFGLCFFAFKWFFALRNAELQAILGGRCDHDVSRHARRHRLDDMAFQRIGVLALQRRALSNSCQFLVFLAFAAAAGPVGAALLVCSR